MSVKLVLALGDAGSHAAGDARHVVGVQLTESPLPGAQAFQMDADRASAATKHQRFRSSPQLTALHRQAPVVYDAHGAKQYS